MAAAVHVPRLGRQLSLPGDNVPVDDPRLAALLLEFTRLSAAAQTQFLDLLNRYLFASPRRRTQQRSQWRSVAVRAVPPADEPAKTEPRPIEPPDGSA